MDFEKFGFKPETKEQEVNPELQGRGWLNKMYDKTSKFLKDHAPEIQGSAVALASVGLIVLGIHQHFFLGSEMLKATSEAAKEFYTSEWWGEVLPMIGAGIAGFYGAMKLLEKSPSEYEEKVGGNYE